MDELKYILLRVLWISQNRQDYDTYAELVDWVKRMENDVTYNDDEGTKLEIDVLFVDRLVRELIKTPLSEVYPL